MKKKIIALLLIVCLAGPPLFAIYEEETGVGVAALLSGEPVLVALGAILLGTILVGTIVYAMSAADEPSNGIYLASDDSSGVEQKEKKDSIFNHVKPVVDIRYSQTGTIQTYIGVRLSF